MVRRHVVESLVKAAQDGMMAAAQDSTSDEVISAFFTMANRALLAALELNANKEPLRMAIERMYALLAEDQVVN